MEEERSAETRKYIRHNMEVPLHCIVRTGTAEETVGLRDISDGGASYFSPTKYERGQAIEMRVPVFPEGPRLPGNIAWAKPDPETPGAFIYGVKFADEKDKKMLRLVEMICHVMTYRAMQEHLTGHSVSADDAAREWLTEYGESFPE